MNRPLTLNEQITVCRQVSRLVHARLPVAGELSKQVGGARQASTARSVDEKVANGLSLADAIAKDDSPDSRVLAACINSGEQSGTLDIVLKNWTAMHIENAASRRAFVTAMLYPVLLVIVCVLAIGFLVWQLVPEYSATFLLFRDELPWWLESVLWVRSHTVWLVALMLITVVAGPVLLYLGGRGRTTAGIPRDKSAAERQQALGCDLAALLIAKEMPLEQVTNFAALACGATEEKARGAVQRIRNQETATPMPIELCAVLSSLHAGAISPDVASKTLGEVAVHIRDSAHIRAVRRARWLPMLVALSVGIVTLLTYTLIIYLPWMWIMQEIGAPENLNIAIQ